MGRASSKATENKKADTHEVTAEKIAAHASTTKAAELQKAEDHASDEKIVKEFLTEAGTAREGNRLVQQAPDAASGAEGHSQATLFLVLPKAKADQLADTGTTNPRHKITEEEFADRGLLEAAIDLRMKRIRQEDAAKRKAEENNGEPASPSHNSSNRDTNFP